MLNSNYGQYAFYGKNFNENTKRFIQQNTSENVCEMLSILSQPQCV